MRVTNDVKSYITKEVWANQSNGVWDIIPCATTKGVA